MIVLVRIDGEKYLNTIADREASDFLREMPSY